MAIDPTVELGIIRISQFSALQWAWNVLQYLDRGSEDDEPLLIEAKKEIREKMKSLANLENIDFDELREELTRRA